MIPNNVIVSGINYTVIEKPFVEINGSRNYQGGCFYTDCKIELSSDLPKTRKEQVFCHELVHAIFNEAGFDDQNEDMINRLGIVLYQVLKDNKLHFED